MRELLEGRLYGDRLAEDVCDALATSVSMRKPVIKCHSDGILRYTGETMSNNAKRGLHAIDDGSVYVRRKDLAMFFNEAEQDDQPKTDAALRRAKQ